MWQRAGLTMKTRNSLVKHPDNQQCAICGRFALNSSTSQTCSPECEREHERRRQLGFEAMMMKRSPWLVL